MILKLSPYSLLTKLINPHQRHRGRSWAVIYCDLVIKKLWPEDDVVGTLKMHVMVYLKDLFSGMKSFI